MDKPSRLLGTLLLCSVAAGAVIVSGCATGESSDGTYKKKAPGTGNGDSADLAGPGIGPDLALVGDFAQPSDMALAGPHDFAFGFGPQPDMRQPVCQSNCYNIVAVAGEVPAFKPDGKDWDGGATDYPDPFVRVTLANGVSGQCSKISDTYFPSWNAVVLTDVPFAELGKQIRFEFKDADGFLNPDDTIVDFTTNFDANDISNGGFTWNIADGYVTLSVVKTK